MFDMTRLLDAAATGDGQAAVALRRGLRNVPAHAVLLGRGTAWTAVELALLGTDTDETVAEKIGRTLEAVLQKRSVLKVPAFRKWRSE